MAELTDAKRRIVEALKRVDSSTAPELAEVFAMSDTAARQHLEALETVGLVERSVRERAGRGRPPVHWRLTAAAFSEFPDRHGELTVELIEIIRNELGDDALERVIAERTRRQLRAYAPVVVGTLAERVERLAGLRNAEGYMAQVDQHDHGFTLTEFHCPINDAASNCQGFCRGELELFQSVLGDDVTVERTHHIPAGDARCAYQVRPRQTT